jgi:hypothetical protein
MNATSLLKAIAACVASLAALGELVLKVWREKRQAKKRKRQ